MRRNDRWRDGVIQVSPGRGWAAAGLLAILTLATGCGAPRPPRPGSAAAAATDSGAPGGAVAPGAAGGAGAALGGAPAVAGAQAAAPPVAPLPLAPGRPQEGALAGGERRAYPLPLAAGDYARLYVEQRLPGDPGVDLLALLVAPGGVKLDESDTPGGVRGGEQLSLVAGAGGDYELVLIAVDPAAPRGAYRVTLEERRPAEAGDEARVEVERLINDASNLRRIETEDADSAALPKLERALRLAEAAGDPGHAGDALTLMGQIALARGRFQAARAASDRALDFYRRAGDRRGEGIVLADLGLAANGLGENAPALERYRQALAVWDELGDHREQANTLRSMSLAALALGDVASAEEWLDAALSLCRQKSDRACEANALVTRSRLDLRRGAIDLALANATRALELGREARARGVEAQALNSLAGIHRLRGDLQAALDTFTEGLDLTRRMGDARAEATVLINIGVVYLDLGEFELARIIAERAGAIFSELGQAEGRVDALHLLGSAMARLGDPAAAVTHYQAALPVSRQVANPVAEAVTQRLLGNALLDLGRVAEAMDALRRALALHIEAGDRVGETFTRLSLGTAQAAAGAPTEARLELEETVRLSVALSYPLAESRARLGLARLDRAAGDLIRAREEVERALAIYEDLRASVAVDQLRTSFFSRSREYYDFYIAALMELADRDPRAAAAAFAASERARARGLLDLLAEARVDLARGISPPLKAEEQRLEQRLSAAEGRLGDLLAAKDAPAERVAEARAEVAELVGERLRLERRIRAEHPRYAEVRYPTPLGLAEVEARLAPGQALLEYSVGQDASFLFVVTREGLATYRLPPAAELRDDVEAFRRAVTSRERRAQGAFVLASRKLYQALVAPAEAALAGARELLIAPDGALYYLPFEALLVPGGAGGGGEPPYLLRDRSIGYVPSASVVASLGAGGDGRGRRGEAEKLFVAFADPDYGGASDSAALGVRPAPDAARSASRRGATGGGTAGLPRLVESAREVREIAALFGAERSALYLRADATEENVKTSPHLATAEWVHFAAHGVIDEAQPRRSGLALARGGAAAEDGVLRVGEIFNLDLGADLVVLSACDTGLGKEVSGEGLVGLTRAFLYAGTPSVVVSLWEVEDRSTADLMVAFKRHLDRGADRAEALRRAKLELAGSANAARPREWAPFILIGARR
jgi:CHAT domain-containing protein/tetratricopeptide (TPR) repeat protein